MSIHEPPLLSVLPATARLASVRTGREIDRAEIAAEVARRAGELAGAGLPRGARVVVAEADGVDFLLAMFACWAAGLVAVGVNPSLAGPEQQNVIEATGARLWLGEKRVAMPDPVPGVAGTPRPLGPDECALILMTSGTTGRPKGIMHSQRSLMARMALNIAEIGAATLREALCVLPVFFGHGLIGNCLTPLAAGGRVHLWTGPDMAELRGLGSEISARQIGFMSSVPSFWKIATRVSDRPARPLARVHVGSAPLSMPMWTAIADWAGTRNVHNMFGMTETANWISGGALDDPLSGDGYVGRIWGGRFAVLAEDGGIAPSGRGEVLVQSPSIMLGYWQGADLDAQAAAGSWFRTGDIGELDPSGALTLVGRIKTEINRAGIKIQAEEIDMMLERHPDIAEACAFGVPDPVAGEAVAAAIVLKPDAVFDDAALKAWCRENARADAVPSRLHVVSTIPRNDRGKIVRSVVRAAVEEPEG